MADFVPVKKLRGENSEPITSWPLPRLCKRCKQTFDPRNPQSFCVYHLEHYSGETAQRWLEPGNNEGGARIHFFWSCCGSPHIDSQGCARGQHITYDEAAADNH